MLLPKRTAVVAGIVVGLVGCSSGGGDGTSIAANGRGTLSVSLMDAPVDGVAEVHVKIASMWLKPSGEGPAVQLEMPSGPVTLNLLALTDQNAAVLVDGAAVPAGDYEWLAMDVEAVPNVDDSFVVDGAGGRHELSVPSNRLRLVSGFEVGANRATRYLIDWDLRAALVNPPGLGRYLLRPAFRVLEVEALGIVTGTVDGTLIDASCLADDGASLDTGNVVYVFAENGIAPDDMDEDGPQPVAFAPVKQVGADWTYRVALAPGAYTLAFTCQAGNDDPEEEDDIEFSAVAGDVELPAADTEVVVNLSAAAMP